jgi:hypothetical protein
LGSIADCAQAVYHFFEPLHDRFDYAYSVHDCKHNSINYDDDDGANDDLCYYKRRAYHDDKSTAVFHD